MTTETEVKTICVQCKYHDNSVYDHRCLNPDVQRKQVGIDPVFGKPLYEMDARSTAFQSPPCIEINKGDCPHFEPKADE